MDRLWAQFFAEKADEQQLSAVYEAPILRIDAEGHILAHILGYLEDYERWLFGSTCKVVRAVVQTHPSVWEEITDLFAALNLYRVIIDKKTDLRVGMQKVRNAVYGEYVADDVVVDAHNFDTFIARINTSNTRVLRLNPKIHKMVEQEMQRDRYYGPGVFVEKTLYRYERRFAVDRRLLDKIRLAFPRLECLDMRSAVSYFGLEPTRGRQFRNVVRNCDGVWLFPPGLKTLIYNGRALQPMELVYFTSMDIAVRMRDSEPQCKKNEMDCCCCGRYVPCACEKSRVVTGQDGKPMPVPRPFCDMARYKRLCSQTTCRKCGNPVCARCQRKRVPSCTMSTRPYCRRCAFTYPCAECGGYYEEQARSETAGGVVLKCTMCHINDEAQNLLDKDPTYIAMQKVYYELNSRKRRQ